MPRSMPRVVDLTAHKLARQRPVTGFRTVQGAMNLLIRGAHLVSGHRADILIDNGEIVGVESIPTAPARRKALTDYRWRQDIPCRGQSIDLDGTLLEAV